MKEKYIKFYGANDLSTPYLLPKVKEFVDEFLINQRIIAYNINDAIEMKHIIRFIDSNIVLLEWTTDFIENLKNIKPQLKRASSAFLQNIEKSDILLSMKELSREYLDDFFDNFQRYDYAKKINENDFMNKFTELGIPIRYLLKNNYFVSNYSISLKDYLLSDSLSIELLLSNFTNVSGEKLYFPKNISNDDWNNLLDEYIIYPDANLNYLSILEKSIKNLDKRQYFQITPKQKIIISNRIANYSKLVTSSNTGVIMSLCVFTNKEDYDNANLNNKDEMDPIEAIDRSIISNIIQSTGDGIAKQFNCSMISLIDKKMINEDHSFDSLIMYLRDYFDFFSKRMISTLPSYPNNEIGSVAKSIGIKTNDSYIDSFYFNNKITLATFKIKTLSQILSEWNIRLEDLISFYFNDYCKKIYKISWLPIGIPHKDESTPNKTATLFRIEESLRKQYLVLSEEGVIESDLVNETPTPDISQLKSFSSNKFVYINETDTAKNVIFLLFSDQSTINYINEHLNGKDFVDLISNHRLKVSDFNSYQKEYLNFLISCNIIIEDNEILKFENLIKVNLLREIYLFESTSYIHVSDEEKIALDEMKHDDLIVFSNTLYTKSEINFLNFILNNKFYDNSWAIRNKYQHGTPHYEYSSQYDYDNSIALLILILNIIKIDNELSLNFA